MNVDPNISNCESNESDESSVSTLDEKERKRRIAPPTITIHRDCNVSNDMDDADYASSEESYKSKMEADNTDNRLRYMQFVSTFR